MADALFELDGLSGFQMQSWSSRDVTWTPMEGGVAPKVWAPKTHARDAVRKCVEWTGVVLIPAMRVVDLSTGEVVWADTSQYPEAGESVTPVWAPSVYDEVRAEFRRQHAAEVAAGIRPAPDDVEGSPDV